jgi:hypothetical protein
MDQGNLVTQWSRSNGESRSSPQTVTANQGRHSAAQTITANQGRHSAAQTITANQGRHCAARKPRSSLRGPGAPGALTQGGDSTIDNDVQFHGSGARQSFEE